VASPPPDAPAVVVVVSFESDDELPDDPQAVAPAMRRSVAATAARR